MKIKQLLFKVLTVLLLLFVTSCSDIMLILLDTPETPTGFTVSKGTYSGYVKLSWDTTTDDVNVYRSATQYGVYTQIKSGISASSYIDNSVNTGSHYWYKVSTSSYSGDSESKLSTAVEGWSKVIAPPVISTYPDKSVYDADAVVEVTIDIANGQEMYYTTDGSDPLKSGIYATGDVTFYIKKTSTIKAYSYIGSDKSEVVTKELNFTQNSLTLNIQKAYFNSLNTNDLKIYINDNLVSTIYSYNISQYYSTTPFTIKYDGQLEKIRFVTGYYSNTFDNINEFASNSTATSLSDIKTIELYPFYNFFSDTYTGTGAYGNL